MGTEGREEKSMEAGEESIDGVGSSDLLSQLPICQAENFSGGVFLWGNTLLQNDKQFHIVRS